MYILKNGQAPYFTTASLTPYTYTVEQLIDGLYSFMIDQEGSNDYIRLETFKYTSASKVLTNLSNYTVGLSSSYTKPFPKHAIAYNTTDKILMGIYGNQQLSSTRVYYVYGTVNESTGVISATANTYTDLNCLPGLTNCGIVYGKTQNKFFIFTIDATSSDIEVASGVAGGTFTSVGSLEAGTVSHLQVAKIDDDRAIVCWYDSSSARPKASICNLSASPSIGASQNIIGASENILDVVYNPATGKATVLLGTSSLKVVEMTVGSGTTLTIGGEVTLTNSILNSLGITPSTTDFRLNYDSNNSCWIISHKYLTEVFDSGYTSKGVINPYRNGEGFCVSLPVKDLSTQATALASLYVSKANADHINSSIYTYDSANVGGNVSLSGFAF